jgi:hypothetical protein
MSHKAGVYPMRLLPRSLSAGPAPEQTPAHPEVLRRYEITVERELVVLRKNIVENYTTFCRECGRDVSMMPPDSAAEVAGTTARNVYRWVEEKRVHIDEPATGKLFICSESLQQLSTLTHISPAGAPELRDPNLPLLPGSSR